MIVRIVSFTFLFQCVFTLEGEFVDPVDGSPVEWTNWLPDNPNVVKGIDDYGYMILTSGTKYGKIDSNLGKLPENFMFLILCNELFGNVKDHNETENGTISHLMITRTGKTENLSGKKITHSFVSKTFKSKHISTTIKLQVQVELIEL